MSHFSTTLVPGRRRPYDTWTFVVLPAEVVDALGRPPLAVRVTIAGTVFRGTAARGEGAVRIPVTADVRARAGVACGDRVDVDVEIDTEPRDPSVPSELQELLDGDAGLRAAWRAMAPSHRRAWAQYVSEAKRPATRTRRAARAPDGIRARAFPR